MSTKEQQKQLWWARTYSRGRAAYLRRCLAVHGLAEGALFYLLVRGIGLLSGPSPSNAAFAGVSGTVFCLLFYTAASYVIGVVMWDRYTRKYAPPAPPSDAPNHALQRTGTGGGAASDHHA